MYRRRFRNYNNNAFPRRRRYFNSYSRRRSFIPPNRFRSNTILDRLTMQSVSVRAKYSFNSSFSFPIDSSRSLVRIPVFRGGGAAPSLIGRNDVFRLYSVLYDSVRLQWIRFKNVMTVFPAQAQAMRIHVLMDRFCSPEDLDAAGAQFINSVPNNPGTVTKLLNNNQNTYINIFSRALLTDEKISWYDSSMASAIIGLSSAPTSGYNPIFYIVLELPYNPVAAVDVNLGVMFEAKYRFRVPKISGAVPLLQPNQNPYLPNNINIELKPDEKLIDLIEEK